MWFRCRPPRFRNRLDAGQQLGAHLARKLPPAQLKRAVVLGLPRGGVPVAYEVADWLGLPLDVLVVRKLALPAQPEFALGAVGESGIKILNTSAMERLGVTEADLDSVTAAERAVIAERIAAVRAVRPREPLEDRLAIIVDDGLATGATARAACHVARRLGAARGLGAVPVAAPDSLANFWEADDVAALRQPRDFRAVGEFYEDFQATSDEEVLTLLREARTGGG